MRRKRLQPFRLALGLIVAGSLLLGSATVGTAAFAPASTPRMLAVALDDVSLGAIALERGEKPPLVALEPLAAALGWHLTVLSNGARLEGNDRTLIVTIGMRTIRENGDLRAMFGEPPIDRGGRIYVAAPDAARLFGLTITRNGKLAFHRPVVISSGTQIVEVPRPPTPHPKPTPRPVRSEANGGFAGSANAGRVVLSVDRSGSTRILHLESQTQGAYLQTRLDSTGIEQFGTPNATVVMGTREHNLSVGYLTYPLSGLIFGGGVYEGVSLHRADARRDAFIGRRLDDGTTSFGEIISPPGSNETDTIAVLTRGMMYQQTLLRRFAVWHHPWGDFSREAIVSDKGAGFGFGARTKGRTFFETAATFATHGLPLGPNDAPIRADIGRELSAATTVVAGFSATPQTPLGPFLGISTHSRNLLAGISATNHDVTATLAYQTANLELQGYTVPGVQRASGLEGTAYFPGLTIDAQSTNTLGTQDTFIEARTNRPGLNLVGGLGVPSGGRPGPIAGLSIPISRMFSLEATLRPSSSGPYRLHLGLAAAIGKRREPTLPTWAAGITVDGLTPLPSMRLFVDGVPVRTFAAASAKVDVTTGTHAFSVESLDGRFGSQEKSVNIEAAGDTVALTLWPERTVKGRIVLAPEAKLPPDFSLAGIVVVVQPGDISAETNAEGLFNIPRQPIGPDSTIQIDPGSLPRELRASEPVAVGAGDAEVELNLLPGLRIERQVFPSK